MRERERADERWIAVFVGQCVTAAAVEEEEEEGGRGVKREDTHTRLDAALYHFTGHTLRNLTYTKCALSVCCRLDFILYSCARVIKNAEIDSFFHISVTDMFCT